LGQSTFLFEWKVLQTLSQKFTLKAVIMKTSFQPLLQWLLNPHPSVTNPEKIQRSRLLSTILLGQSLVVLIILALVLIADPYDIAEPTVRGAFLLVAIAFAMYFVNRYGSTSFAALGYILPFVAIFIYIPFYSGEDPIFLAFLMIPVILTAIFFSIKRTTIVSIGILVFVTILLTFIDPRAEGSPYWNLRNMWYFLILATGLILTFMWHLGNLEQVRQQELIRVNKQLEQQLAEMERFTYAVSHDLKSPIVTIKGFLGMLQKDIQENRQDRIETDFKRISSATEKMGILLSELLDLSRIGRIVNRPEAIAPDALIHEILKGLDDHIQKNNISIQISTDLPTLYADRVRLQEVFENLIDNAAKYMGDQPNPLIEIGVRKQGMEQIIFVRDNGMGIEPKYQTKIFALFEKLHAEIEGSGVGLALVKRIIEVHGGNIWVESEGHGKGSTFYFTIPGIK
jgi:signal transduction histidine kinase